MATQQQLLDEIRGLTAPANGAPPQPQVNDAQALLSELRQLTNPQQPQQETLEQRALRLGAQPGIAITPEQQQQIAAGQPIQPKPATLDELLSYQEVGQQKYMDPLARSMYQGAVNIGSGILRGIGELRKAFGDEEAEKFLNDLAIGTAIERKKTQTAVEGSPISSFVGEVLGESAAFPIAGMGKSLITKILTGAAAGGAAGAVSEAGRGGTSGDIVEEAAKGTFIGGLSEGVIKGGVMFKDYLKQQRRLAREAQAMGFETEIASFNTMMREIEQGRKEAQATGIEFLPAQLTRDPFQQQQTAFLGQNPEISQKAFHTLTKQNQQAADAVEQLLNEISVPENAATAPARARQAATNILDAAELARREAADKLYKPAYDMANKRGLRVDVEPVIDLIRQKKGKYGEVDTMGRLLNKLENIIGGPGTTDVPQVKQRDATRGLSLTPISKAEGEYIDRIKRTRERATLQRMHGIKMGNDKRIKNLLDKDNIDKVMSQDLVEIQKKLLDQMDALNVGYREARKTYEEMSPSINNLLSGVIGTMSRISDNQLKNISGKLFDPVEGVISPAVMNNAIKTLSGVTGGKEIARGLLRVELQKRMGRASSRLGTTGQSAVANVPFELMRGVFGKNRQEKELLYSALRALKPEYVENAKFLESALQRASEARPGGSPTGIREVITQKLRGPANRIWDFFMRPMEGVADLTQQQQFNAKVAALGDALYNPAWQPDMDKLRKLGADDPRALVALTQLMDKIAKYNYRVGTLPTAGRVITRDEE